MKIPNINVNMNTIATVVKYIQVIKALKDEGVELWAEMKDIAQKHGLSDETKALIQELNNESLEDMIVKLGMMPPKEGDAETETPD